ncbi:DEAD/DEAH box helicase [Thalassomonas sp. RHCl1]|uniref:DEAD/DEAH box helicase n=1 Tax=Thalassomonas sp. RHCl1 TaxID=2995320 RepID=UPI00248CA8F9|nr:DEAD/DEAH box helicase [Thalassomonas sp. RHCl1]
MKIATFASVWGSITGGIDVFNKELVKGFASIGEGIEICACLQVNTSELQKDCKDIGFKAITPGSKEIKHPSANDISSWSETEFNAVNGQMTKQNFEPDIILLHDIFCKELLSLVRENYPDAKVVTFFHSAYGRSEKRKGKADTEIDRKENYQREMLQESDLAISVGSFSKNYLQSLDSDNDANIDYILPGLPVIKSQAKKSKYFNAMSFGRLDPISDSIKQISLSAKAWNAARASESIDKLITTDVKFFAIGSSGDKNVLEEEQEKLRDSSQAAIRVIPFEDIQSFDSSDLKVKMESCAFILLTSWYENFGLTYLEACSFGTPAIISENSGFFHDLKQVIGEETTESLLITVPTNGISEKDLLEKIKTKLIGNAQNYDEVFNNAQKLRSNILKKWPTWEKVASQLFDKFSTLKPETHPATVVESIESSIQDQVETPPYEETIKDLSTWCWSKNISYHKRMINESGIDTTFHYPLTHLQKAFWERREELTKHRFKDLILSGGTSSGKTTLAEHLFGISRPHEFARARILYIAPTKALAQERAKAWKKIFPSPNLKNSEYDPVIVSTGDNNASDGALMRGDFNIASTVYEKANVILSASQDLFKKLNMVVIDEFHMIEDLHRGSILECLLAKIKLEKERRIDSTDEDDQLRMVIITTEKPGNALKNFMTFYDYDLSEDISPLVLADSSRAKPVTHSCIVPGRAEINNSSDHLPAIFDIKTFNNKDPLLLTTEESQNVCDTFETFRTSLTQIPEKHGFDARRTRREYYKEFIDQWMRNNLYGQRLLVFMSSKFEVLEVAKFIKNFVRIHFEYDCSAAKPITPNESGIATALKAISEIETTDFASDLKNCAEEGIFIHNADVPQKVRENFEDYLGKSLPGDCRSEIVFATETLSFGVNLKVTDVVLFNVLFPEGERVQTAKPKSILLSRCDFANMAGRAGRLGQSNLKRNPHVYWYLDPEEEKSFERVLESFYINPPEIRSQLFYRSDARTLAELEKYDHQYQALNEGTHQPSERQQDDDNLLLGNRAIEKFSYPFSRSVLDGIRFLGGTERENDHGFENHGQCTVDEVIRKIFYRTLYYSQNCDSSQELDEPHTQIRCAKKKKELISAVSKVIESAATYNLIRKPATGGYQITPLGCSTIDTGTEIATVTKLRSSLLALNGFWNTARDTHLPFELAILPVFFQPEVHRQYLARLPEFRLAMEWNAAENRNDLISRATQLLASMQVIKEEDEAPVQQILHKFMRWILKNHPVVNAQGRYEEAPQDSCFRLFVAFLTWISGASLRNVIGEIQRLYPSSGQTTSSSVFNFESFAENLTWKVLFLVSLIRASEDQILPASSTFNAVRFVHRSRFGCTEKAIPLLFKNKHTFPPFNRVKVHALLGSGYSSADIAMGNLNELSDMDAPHKRKIVKHVRTFIIESFQEVSKQFSYLASGGNSVTKANEEVSKEYWAFANEQVHNMLHNATPKKGLWSMSDSEENNNLSALILSDEKEGQLLVSRSDNGVELQTYSPGFDSDGSDRISVRKANHYRAYFSFGDQTNLTITEHENIKHIIVVDFPWTAGATGEFGKHCRLSPAAFGILLSLCARNFVIDIDHYLKSIISGASEGSIGTRKLYALSEPHLQRGSFPESLFEAWAKYIEVGEF